jgi:dihydroflavonol-4-reductase
MKIFITGATGFIGSHVVKLLVQTEHELRCLVRKSSQIKELEELSVKLITGDLTDKDSLLEGMKGCDWVLDIANVYTFWMPNKKIYTEVNVIGTRNVMESALQAGISKVVHVSTAAIYGKPSDSPFTEDSPVGPLQFSEYARTKYEGELIAWELYEKKGLPLVMIYPVAVLGPGDPKTTGQYIMNLINRKMPALVLTDAMFTFVHVRDVAEAIIRAAEKENNIGEKYLVGNHQLPFGEINKMVSEISGVPLPKLRLPDFLTTINAAFLTLVANMIKKPPLWGMSTDQIRTMKEGAIVDGSKAERELGIKYTPVRVALEEAIESYKN